MTAFFATRSDCSLWVRALYDLYPAGRMNVRIVALIVAVLLQASVVRAADRITILTDAFARNPHLQQDWGYAALVEIGGRRILFDTGNNEAKFKRNIRALGVDLRRLDFVVISHRHGDHTAGLRFLRKVNPRVRIYAPADEHFGGPTPPVFFRPEPSLPKHMRYFDGQPPAIVPHGTAWEGIAFELVTSTTEVMPGVRVIEAVSEAPGMRDLRELALAIDTPSGQVVMVGCSHPGVATLLKGATANGKPVRLLAGGFHWVTTPLPEITRMAAELRDHFKVAAVAPGHCTGEAAFAELQKTFGDKYVYAGVGTVIALE
jgi:7,8-dihydropterin-6-yl-methyl-4-(beta-D-ribofuranosyl)aminobenzene 5'-phosphate synthase